MEIKTVEMGDGVVRIIDQTLLPGKYEIREIKTKEEMWEAIKMLRVRGRPRSGSRGQGGCGRDAPLGDPGPG